jgi:hypothetical protein
MADHNHTFKHKSENFDSFFVSIDLLYMFKKKFLKNPRWRHELKLSILVAILFYFLPSSTQNMRKSYTDTWEITLGTTILKI